MFYLSMHNSPFAFTSHTKHNDSKQAGAKHLDGIQKQDGVEEAAGEEMERGEARWMDGAFVRKQRERDGRSGVPMGLVSLNNLHIREGSFK